MTLTYQRFTVVLLLIYGSHFLSGIYYCLRMRGAGSNLDTITKLVYDECRLVVHVSCTSAIVVFLKARISMCYIQRMGISSWLSHCATSRKVASSIPDDVIAIFH